MFQMQTEQTILEQIHFFESSVIPAKQEDYIRQFYKLPQTVSISVEMKEHTVFPELFLKPYPMVSEMMMRVMRLYRVKPNFRSVVMVDRVDRVEKHYFLLYINEKSKPLYRDFEIKRAPDGELRCQVSLDFAESILRRNAKGIELYELSEEESDDDGTKHKNTAI